MMSRIAAVVSSNIDTKVTAAFSQSEASLDKVLNIFDALTNAPVALV
jgi:hypothetical protein